MKDMKNVANFLFEVGMLAKTPRSGFFFLGSGEQSVSEHTTRCAYIGFTLAMLDGQADANKILKMCLFHDISESRISDLNYVHQKYTERKEEEAIKDLVEMLPFGKIIEDVIEEYEKRETIESKIAKDADNLEFLISLKEQVDIGNTRAESWIPSIKKRLFTESAKSLADAIMDTDSDNWWFGDKNDDWWVNRNQKTLPSE
jgi:putative hydrolase of HD superfamily